MVGRLILVAALFAGCCQEYEGGPIEQIDGASLIEVEIDGVPFKGYESEYRHVQGGFGAEKTMRFVILYGPPKERP